MKNTSFKIENVFGDVIAEENFCEETITKLKTFSAKIM